jgi:hypothetical protein
VYVQETVTVSWNQAVHTDREVTAKRPDIIIKNRKNMHTDRCGNTCRQKWHIKERAKEAKIQEFMYRVQQMWHLKCKIIPVIIAATGILTEGLRKNLEVIPGKHSVDSLQKTAILRTSHIMRKVLQCET